MWRGEKGRGRKNGKGEVGNGKVVLTPRENFFAGTHASIYLY